MTAPSEMESGSGGGDSGTESRQYIRKLLNKLMRVKLTDGRVLVGQFLCTDREANVILGTISLLLSTLITKKLFINQILDFHLS